MPSKVFVILAKSVKHKKFCVAGKIYSKGSIGEWVRPINPLIDSDALTYSNIEYSSKKQPELLHITSFRYLKSEPHPIQLENYSIDSSFYWKKEGVFDKKNINILLDYPQTLWANGYSSSNGVNDRFPVSSVSSPIQSLYFVYTSNLKIRIKKEGIDFGNDLKRFRGLFSYNNVDYAFIITDPNVYSEYGQLKEDTYDVGGCYVTLSTAPHTDGYCYKFLTAIIK
ncbi:dual OB domain-containing protein [Pantoea stewartii]|uniref:dual OB domain-containing protein n=1 Tax=Pantoea stewartii TaxID=66269 RepID=UPI00162A6C9B|nr:hypothetical protein [Pantoea stewartii]MBC0854485.1 hypothetical protein [Pantoea stewartii]